MKRVQQVRIAVENRVVMVQSGKILVDDLRFIDEHLDRYLDLIPYLQNKRVDEKRHMQETVVMRLKEVEAFRLQQSRIKTLVKLCTSAQGNHYDLLMNSGLY